MFGMTAATSQYLAILSCLRDWMPLVTPAEGNIAPINTFLRSSSYFSKTAPTATPQCQGRCVVTRWVRSVESRVNHGQHTKALSSLCDSVFVIRNETFHCNLENGLEGYSSKGVETCTRWKLAVAVDGDKSEGYDDRENTATQEM